MLNRLAFLLWKESQKQNYDWEAIFVDVTIVILQISNILMNYGISQSIRQAYTVEVNLREKLLEEE